MPITKGAAKRLRQTIKRERRNVNRVRVTKGHVKALLKAISTNNKEAAMAAYKKAQSQLDRAAGKGLVHKNKAARQKARLAKLVENSKTADTPKKSASKTSSVAKKTSPKPAKKASKA